MTSSIIAIPPDEFLRKTPEEQEAIIAAYVAYADPTAVDKSAIAWTPFPARPQEVAYHCLADELYFGGAAGAAKTELLIGLALTRHRRSIIFRREFPQLLGIIERMHEIVRTTGSFNGQTHVWHINDGRTVELGAVQHEWDMEKYQGRPHDFLGFDELPQFTRKQYRFLIGWNRTSLPNQRCRVVGVGNPPLNPEDRWVIEEWAPWLDDKHPDPAEPGELRWYAMLDDVLTWLKSPAPIPHRNKLTGELETIVPRSRTFIPGRVDDNPVLMARGYKSVLQGMPEPLRSQLLYGDMNAGTSDDPWQVVPTAWVRAAMERSKGALPIPSDAIPSALGVDVARGGKDKTVLAPRYRTRWGPLLKYPGTSTPDGPAVVQLIQRYVMGRQILVSIDVIGVGASVYDGCVEKRMQAMAIGGGNAPPGRDSSGQLEFVNLRAWAYWHMRELLDPSNPLGVQEPPILPDDNELLADLCAPRFRHTPGGILVEKKEDIVKRIHRSPDCGDAVIYSMFSPRHVEPVVKGYRV